MKKFKYVFVLLLAILFIPLMTFADGEENNTTDAKEDNRVNLYFFRGEGCPHCQEAEEWFKSIEEEYGSKFKVVDYETWNDEDNRELMEKVAESRGEKAEGVPYIIIGKQSWNGFAESYTSEMKEAIDSEYEKAPADRYDVMKNLGKEKKEKKDSGSDVVALLAILVVTGGVCFGVYKARNNTN